MYVFQFNVSNIITEFAIFKFFFLISFMLAIFLFVISWVFSTTHTISLDQDKLTAYECGFDPFQDSHNIFDVKFYLVSILFILFDLEIIYILP
jgi:NADH:ubiquinone oxidoreductase subunit 3 (subunit A)